MVRAMNLCCLDQATKKINHFVIETIGLNQNTNCCKYRMNDTRQISSDHHINVIISIGTKTRHVCFRQSQLVLEQRKNLVINMIIGAVIVVFWNFVAFGTLSFYEFVS